MSQIILQGIGATVELVEQELQIYPVRPGSDPETLCHRPEHCSGPPSLRVAITNVEKVSLIPADLRRCGYLAFRFQTPCDAEHPESTAPSPYVIVLFPHHGNGAAHSIHRALGGASREMSPAPAQGAQDGQHSQARMRAGRSP